MTHRTRRLFATALTSVTLITFAAGCSDDEAGTDADATTTTAVVVTDPPADVTTTLPEVSTLPSVETVPPTAPEGPVQIDVVVGVDSSPTREEHVKAGEDVTINITNPDAADEFHIHGIDLEQAVDAGVMATFNFTADTPGTYEVESHETEDVLVVIVVE